MSKYRSDTNEFELIDISKWDVSKVESMKEIFYKCYNFNCDISNWSLNKRAFTSGMFDRCPMEEEYKPQI